MNYRLVFLSLLLSTNLYSLSITVSLGEDSNSSYSLLEITKKDPFHCEHIEGTHKRRDYIICNFDKLPLVTPEKTENSFFKIIPYIEKRYLFIEIIPKFQARLFPKMISTLEDKYIFKKKLPSSRKWFILGFKEKAPYLQDKELDGLNFPIKIPQWEYPTIGTLDVSGIPIGQDNQGEYKEYEILKGLYKRGDYRTLIDRIDRKMKRKEINKLFMPEILSLKIRALYKQGDKHREIVETGGPWVKSYTSHKDLPEIMFIVANSYLEMGVIIEVNRLLETLIREFPGDSFAERAMILNGERVTKEGKAHAAKKMYEKVLYNSDDVEVASLAAAKLAHYYLTNENVKEASNLYRKILKSNPEYFQKDLEASFRLARDLSDRKVPDISAELADIITQGTEKTSVLYKDAVLAAARWYKDSRKYDKSMGFYEIYIEDFSFVKNIETIRTEIDYLKYEMDIGSDEERLKFYDYMIAKYSGKDIAEGSIYKKMMLYVDRGRFIEVEEYLPVFEQLEERLFPNIREDVKRIARKLVKVSLTEDRCEVGVSLLHQYNILLPNTYDLDMYNCAMTSGDFDLAIVLAQKYIDSESAIKSLPWQKRELASLYRKSDYFEYEVKAERIIRMEQALDRNPDINVLFKLFDAYIRLGKPEKLVPILELVEKHYKGDPNILDLYKGVIEAKLAANEYEDVMNYGVKLLNSQRLMRVDTFSPFVDFAVADSAKELKNYGMGINVLEDLVKSEKLTLDDYFQSAFKLGELYSLNAQEELAKSTFNNCVEKEGESSWKELCKQKNP